MLKMKKWKIVALLLISILSISMIVYKKNLDLQKNEHKIKWEKYDAGSIKELHYLDEEKRIISFRGSEDFTSLNGWASIGDRYLVLGTRTASNEGIDEEPKKGWTWHAIVYDLDYLDKKPEKVDLYQVVKNYDKNFYLLFQGNIVIEDEKEYLLLTLQQYEKKNRITVKMDLDSNKIVGETTEKLLKSNYPTSHNLTSLGDAITNSNVYNRNDFFIFSYPYCDCINFEKDYSKFIQLGKANKEDKMVVAFRKRKISVEESYQMLRHWFAPLGQNKLEVIGTYESNDGEKQTKVLETYQEFAEWTHLERDW